MAEVYQQRGGGLPHGLIVVDQEDAERRLVVGCRLCVGMRAGICPLVC
jgi:hypothetical protein